VVKPQYCYILVWVPCWFCRTELGEQDLFRRVDHMKLLIERSEKERYLENQRLDLISPSPLRSYASPYLYLSNSFLHELYWPPPQGSPLISLKPPLTMLLLHHLHPDHIAPPCTFHPDKSNPCTWSIRCILLVWGLWSMHHVNKENKIQK